MPASLLREFKLRFSFLGHDAPSSGALPLLYIKEPILLSAGPLFQLACHFFPQKDYANLVPKADTSQFAALFM